MPYLPGVGYEAVGGHARAGLRVEARSQERIGATTAQGGSGKTLGPGDDQEDEEETEGLTPIICAAITAHNSTRNMPERLKKYEFAPGQSGNALGRPIGGRMRALRALDDILNEADCAKLIKDTLRDKLKEDPYKFFQVIVMPLMPRQVQSDETQSRRLIISFVDAPPKEEKVIDVEDETNKGE